MQHIAHNRHREIGKIFFVMPNREHIQQPLCGVGVATIARIDNVDMGRNVLGDQIRCARFAVAHHEHIGGHCAQIGNRIQQRFTFRGTRTRNIQIDNVRRKASSRDFKGRAGAG